MKIDLSSDWVQYENIHTKARVFINGEFLNSHEFAKYVYEMNFDNLSIELSKINGFFSFIKKDENKCIIVSDRVRSIPLFYTKEKNALITDNPYKIDIQKKTKNEAARIELLLSGCISGFDTLYEGINQTQAGEIITLYDDKINIDYYFRLEYDLDIHKDLVLDNLISKHFDVLQDVFDRLINYVDGRTIIVPLSGGYDSRLIASMLKKLNYDNVITYTFGKENNGESIISKQVANDLGYEWIFIPYTNKYTYDVYNSREYKNYQNLPDNAFSICQDREWPAVWELKKKKAIPRDAVFVPGHSGDFLTTLRIPEYWKSEDSFDSKVVADSILDKHYVMWNWSQDFVNRNYSFYDNLIAQVKKNKIDTFYEAVNSFKQWEFLQIQVKYIINSVKIYEFWGYDWWLPLWDKDYIDFWLHMPLKCLDNKNSYNTAVARLYSEISGRSFKESLIRATGDNIYNSMNIMSYLKGVIKKTPLEQVLRRLIHNKGYKEKRTRNGELRENDWEQALGRLNENIYDELHPYIVGRSSCKTLHKLNYINFDDKSVDKKVINMLKEMKG